jgi:hypothetical protein
VGVTACRHLEMRAALAAQRLSTERTARPPLPNPPPFREREFQNCHRPSEPFSEPSESSARSGRQAASALAHSAGVIVCLRFQ